MDHTRDLSQLHTRLDQLADRMTEARSSFAAAHPEFEHDLAAFIDRHDSIRSLIDETRADSAISTAERATSDLETGLESWLRTVDERYKNPPARIDSVSM
jgi:predicted transcriptional regulator